MFSFDLQKKKELTIREYKIPNQTGGRKADAIYPSFLLLQDLPFLYELPEKKRTRYVDLYEYKSSKIK